MAVLSDDEVIKRVESPMNLFNRLRSVSSRKEKESLIVSIPKPFVEDLIPNIDEKVTASSSRTRALSVMNKVLGRLDDEDVINSIRVDRLPGIVSQMATAVKGLEPEKDRDINPVQFVIYTPTVMKEEDFGEVIEVKE